MKIKFFLPALFAGLWILTPVLSQNFQMHYDMGEDRGYMTSTIEMFKPDKWGSTFYFVDFDYDPSTGESVSLAYMEIARGLRFWDNPFEIHVEYNGGFGQFSSEPFNGAYPIHDAWLFGGHYTWSNDDFSRNFTLQGMYKYIRNKHDASFQITGVWNIHFADQKFSFTGFADFWKEDFEFEESNGGGIPDLIETHYVFLAEPQIWYNLTSHFSLGGEVELASNFGGHRGFKVSPTLAAKWNF